MRAETKTSRSKALLRGKARRGSKVATARRERRAGADGHYDLDLYVTGSTVRSGAAVLNIKRLCEEHLPGHYRLRIVDVYQHPAVASREQVVAAPTLIKRSPPPLARLVGDFSDRQRVLAGLGLDAS